MVEGEGNPTTWKFTQCFGDKGDVEDITEGMLTQGSYHLFPGYNPCLQYFSDLDDQRILSQLWSSTRRETT